MAEDIRGGWTRLQPWRKEILEISHQISNLSSGSLLKEKTKKKKAAHLSRPTWEEYFMDITHLVAKRSTCLRRHVGAVLVKDKKILATGYNGAPSRLEHCLDIGCLREQQSIPSGERHELCRGLHAEQNAIIQAAYHGVGIRGATLYCTNHPCVICSKMIINAGIERVIYEQGYADDLSAAMLKESGVKVQQFNRK
jgi:dCMP deaminase